MRKPLLLVLISLLAQLAWSLDRQPNADYRARRQALAAKTNGAAVLLFAPTESEGPNALYGFRQNDNFFYLTGWPEPGAALLIVPPAEAKGSAAAQPYTEIFFLPEHNVLQEKWTGPKLGPKDKEAPSATGFDHVAVLDDMRTELARLLPQTSAVIYTEVAEDGETSASTVPLGWLKRANAFPLRTSFRDLGPLLGSLRMYKDAGEIERVRKATNASIAGHKAAFRTVKPPSTEREISALLQYEWGKQGCERPAYAPIVGAGFNTTVLHYSDDSGPIRQGDLLLIDAAGEYSMYASDITRTMPASGKFTARQREIYDIVYGAQQAAIAAFRSGKSHLLKDQADSLYNVARDYIDSHGKDLHGASLGQYFIHGLGHYVGLGVHDSGDYDVPLGPGMVFTIEPGIYIPEERLGVRIEDTFYVDKDGQLIDLVADLPHTADEVERAMAAR